MNYFGLRKYSTDGFNPCCKDCRNFRRRKAYQDPHDLMDPIYPINEHNRHFLWSLSDSIKKESLVGLDLQTLKPVSVIFRRNGPKEFHLTIKVIDGAEYIYIHGGPKEGFIDFVLPLLLRLQIRLFHPADSIALSNWGLSQTF